MTGGLYYQLHPTDSHPIPRQKTLVAEVEILREELQEIEVTIEGQFVDQNAMVKDRKWSKPLN